MKKKAIEAVPYLTLPKTKRIKAQYIAVTADRDVAGEPHLFIEVYRNRRQDKAVPVVRIVLCRRDFGNYFPEEGRWSREGIRSNIWRNGDLLWEDNVPQGIPCWARNVLNSAEDLQRLSRFLDGETVTSREWYHSISRWQQAILRMEHDRRRERRYERRQAALNARQQATPELDEQDVRVYADTVLFGEKHYLYYKKHGTHATVVCSACGGVSENRWKAGLSYESRFERTIGEPRADTAGTCPLCGAWGTYKPLGRAKSYHSKEADFYIGEKYGARGMVFRYIAVAKEWSLDRIGDMAAGASEHIRVTEVARTYFEPGKKPQTDYHKWNPYSADDFWDDCNLGGLGNIRLSPAWIHPDTYTNMRGTFLQYSALQEYVRTEGEVKVTDYMENYTNTPQIEMLVKMGLTDIVRELILYHYGIIADVKADRIDGFLGIRKEHFGLLQEKKGDLKLLRIMQYEKRYGLKWTDGQVEKMAELGLQAEEISILVRHMGVTQVLNRVSKYAGCGYGTGASCQQEQLHRTAQLYADYLTMCESLHYDMTDSIRLHPHDLTAEHDKMVLETSRAAADARIRAVLVKYPLIKKHYRRLYGRYHYEKDGYFIRPARNAGEIVMEGRLLHHCVGGDNYLGRHDRGESYILFLRESKAPGTPYITVELTPDMTIRQWYGAYDRKPDEQNMRKWLDGYLAALKSGTDSQNTYNADGETLVPAAI